MLDRERQILEEKQIEHSGSGIGQLIELLLKHSAGRPELVAIAIETPRGAVVEALVERQFAVYSLNAKQMDRFRDRHTVPGAKDDSRDAFVMANSLRTDLHLFHRVRLDEAGIIRLRELTRAEEDLQHEVVRYHGARVHAQHDECAKQHYAELHAKGHSHGRALRGIADRLIAVLVAMLRTRTLYDPAGSSSPARPADGAPAAA